MQKKKDWNQSRLPNSISLIFQTKKTKLKFWKIVDLTISRLIIDQRLKENAPWTLKKKTLTQFSLRHPVLTTKLGFYKHHLK